MMEMDEDVQVVRDAGSTKIDNRIFLLHLGSDAIAVYVLCMSAIMHYRQLDTLEKVADMLQMSLEELVAAMGQLQSRGLAHCDVNGDWSVSETPGGLR